MRLNEELVGHIARRRGPEPVVIAADGGDTAWLRRLTNAIGNRASVRSTTREMVVAAAIRTAPLAVILPVVDAQGSPAAPILRRLLDRLPATEVILSVPMRGGLGPHVMSAARAGAARFAYEDDEFGKVVRDYLDDRVASNAAELVPRVSRPVVSLALRPVRPDAARLLAGIADGRKLPTSAGKLARREGTSLRSLNDRQAEGWPPGRVFLSWGRLLAASAALEQGASEEGAAELAGYANRRTMRQAYSIIAGLHANAAEVRPVEVVTRMLERCPVLRAV